MVPDDHGRLCRCEQAEQSVDGAAREAAARAALDQGYHRALAINANNTDALVPYTSARLSRSGPIGLLLQCPPLPSRRENSRRMVAACDLGLSL